MDVVGDAHDWVDGGSAWRKMTFLVDPSGGGVESGLPAVRLDPDEHEDFAWVSEREVLEGKCGGGRVLTWTSPEQKVTILDAFELLRSRGREDWGRGGR